MTLPELSLQRPWMLLLVLLVPLLYLLRRRVRLTGAGRAQTWLRALQIVAMALVLTGPMLVSRASSATAIFLVDQSASVPDQSLAAADGWIGETMAAADPESNVSVIGFGAAPALLQPPGPVTDASIDVTDTGGRARATTDIASALELAMTLPVGEQRRLVLLSDGSANAGDTNALIERARQAGIPIDVVPLNGIDANDLRIAQVAGPSAIWQGESLSLLVTVGSGATDTAEIAVSVDGQEPLTRQVPVPAGSTSLSVELPPMTPGFHAIEVTINGNPDLDRIVENNAAPFAVVVRDQPQVLVLAPIGADPSRFVDALTAQGAHVDVMTPDQVPTDLATLGRWDAVVLDNVPSWELSAAQQQSLVTHTRDGHGLIVIGGTASYGPGSYAGTPLEEALPVSVKVTDGRQRPKVAVLIVMDKSGSMSYDPSTGGTSKLQLAKDGVITAASALTTGDEIGVIAFNDEPIWALPMTEIAGQDTLTQIDNAIKPLNPDGGTEMFPALTLAYDTLRNADADVRHIILLSDGKSRSGTREAYDRMIAEAAKDNVSLSAVALGDDADIELLQALAQQGGGRYHYATTPEQIPNITFEEAKSAGSQSILRGSFRPVQTQPSVILNDIDVTAMPMIDGYNFAAAKPGAQVDLTSDRRDPLLSRWQLGLGRVVAWTADDGSDFASAWSTWTDYEAFWGNALRWSLPDPDDGMVRVSSAQDGADTIVTLDGTRRDGSIMSLSDAAIAITAPDGSAHSPTLLPSGNGQWDIRLTDAATGAWRVSIEGATGGSQLSAIVVPPSLEYQPDPAAATLLTQIAAATGGRVLSLEEPASASIFSGNSDHANAPGTIREVWQWPLVAFLVLFLTELALRLGWMELIRERIRG